MDGPVHAAFGLTYASYFVAPRSLLQQMPEDWQIRFVELVNELNATYTGWEPPKGYRVLALDRGGKLMRDPFRNYRRPDNGAILRAKKGSSL